MAATDDHAVDRPLAAAVRAETIRRGGVGSVLAFWWLLFACSVAMAAVVFHAASWYPAVNSLQLDFGASTLHRDPAEYLPWLARQVERWPEVVAASPADPAAIGVVVLVALVLLGFGYRALRPPVGRSLLELDSVRAGAEAVLRRFGHFEDIRVSGHPEGFHARGRVLFAQYHFLKNVAGAVTDGIDAGLRYFMVHEYVHQVTRDNVVHGVARLLLLAFGPMAILYVFMFVLFTSMFEAPLALGPLIYFAVVCTALYVVLFAILSSVELALLGQVKAREFYADRVAATMVPELLHPYGEPDGTAPSATSAWARRVSVFERALHQEGRSLHARNLLPGGLVLHAVARTLYLMFCPAGAGAAVLALDIACAGSLLYLAVRLPPRPMAAGPATLAPWAVCLVALLGLWFSTVGLAGAMQMAGIEVATPQWGVLLSWPLIASWTVALVVLVRGAWIQWRAGTAKPAWPDRPVRTVVLAVLTAPGALAFLLMFLAFLLLSGTGTLGLVTVLGDPASSPRRIWLSLLLVLLALAGLGILFRGWIAPSKPMFLAEAGIAFGMLMLMGVLTGAALIAIMRRVNAGGGSEGGPVLPVADDAAYLGAAGLCIVLWIFYVIARVVERRCRSALSGGREVTGEWSSN